VRLLQRRLHDRGFNPGGESGEYDRPTADAVGRFQRHAHIEHGGYLSLDTWDALNGDEPGPPPPIAERRPLSAPPRYDQSRPETDIPPPARFFDQAYGQQDLPPPHEDRYDQRYARRDLPPAPPQARVIVRRDDVGGVQRYYSHQSYSRSSSSVSPPATVYGGGYGYTGDGYAAGGAYGHQGGYASAYGYDDSYGAQPAGPPVYAQPVPPPQGYPGPDAGWRPPYAAVGAGSAVQNGYLVWGGKTRF
jgi:hypothetical protein